MAGASVSATPEEEFAAVFARLLDDEAGRAEHVTSAIQALVNAGRLNKVTAHRYRCRRGCDVATVIVYAGRVLCRTRDYKMSRGLNEVRSVPEARSKNTLDGSRHWPGHDFDVTWLATWGPDARMTMDCRHQTHAERAVDVLALVEGVRPGHPGRPTIL